MVAESFRGTGEQMPIGGLGVIGLSFALVGCDSAVGPEASPASADPRRTTSASSASITSASSAADDRAFWADDPPRGLPVGEYYALTLFSIAGDDDDGHGNGSADDLHRARDPLDCGLRAHRAAPGLAAIDERRSRSSCSVPSRARSSCTDGADLRAHRLDAPGPHRHVDGAEGMHVTPMMLFAVGCS
jgi:hypothetical protein